MRRTATRSAAILILLLLALVPLAALDWGGTLDNATTYTWSGASSWLQQDKLALWLETELGPSLTLSAQGSYTFSNERYYLFDVDMLTLRGRFVLEGAGTSLLEFTAGRFGVSDFSGVVLADNLDGVEVLWRTPRANLALTVGTTALQLSPVSTVGMSWGDLSSTSLLAPPRLIEMVSLELPELFGRQDLLIALLLQQDLRSQTDLIQPGETVEVAGRGGRLSTEYLGVALRGPLPASLYYDLFAYLGTGRTLSYLDGQYDYAWILSGLLGGGVRYFRQEWLSSRAELRLLFASGDSDYANFVEGNRQGLGTLFVPVSRPDLALVFTPVAGNLAVLELGYSIKPLPALQTQLTGFVFLRPTSGPVSDGRVDPASDSTYLGAEIDAIARYRPFSDLGLALSAGVFFPGDAFRSENQEVQFRTRLEISFSF